MAIAQCSHLSFSLPLLLKRQPAILSLSSIFTPIPNRRRNHLRQKLLKTLTKPYPNNITSVEPHRIEKFDERIESEEVTFTQEKAEIGSVYDVVKGHFGRYWYFKLGMYLVGILVFQTVCAIWVFGFDDVVQKEEKDSVFEGELSEKSSLLSNKIENLNLGTSSMEERLGEIQAMARKVREKERLKSLADEEEDGVFKSEIEKEVDRELLNIQKKLDGVANMPAVPLREDDYLKGKYKNEPLMTKNKYKFKGSSGSLSEKPKGFTGTKDYRVSNMGNSVLGKEAMQNELVDENGNREIESRMGATQEASVKRPVASNRSTNIVGGERFKGKAGQWWQNLPYVVAVVMDSGHDGEGPRGLFTLKANPYANDEDDLSHIVAFEDRGDATNLCYILESFFEDLGDFRADIVPLSVKDLAEEVKTHSKKVVVVKKRQLKLYAGQPLAEVEMALRSLVQ